MTKTLIPAEISIELEAIAESILDIPTLKTRMRDSLDFHEVAVWEIKAALDAAYLIGKAYEST